MLIGLAVSAVSLPVFGGFFGGGLALSGSAGAVLNLVVGLLYLPTVLVGFILSLLFGPIGETPHLLIASVFLGQICFYPITGYWLGGLKKKPPARNTKRDEPEKTLHR